MARIPRFVRDGFVSIAAVLAAFAAACVHAQSAPFTCPPQASAYSPGIALLNVPAAWQRTCGTAYVGVLDNGVQLIPELHPQLKSNVRLRFSRNLDAITASDALNVDEISQNGSQGH